MVLRVLHGSFHHVCAHLSREEPRDFLPVERVEIKVYQLLCNFRLDVPPKLDPQLLHRELFRQARLQLLNFDGVDGWVGGWMGGGYDTSRGNTR